MLIGVVFTLIVIRLVLPTLVLFYANKTLANRKGYFGHINDIDLCIFRGAYTIRDVYLNKVDTISNTESDFFKSRNIDLSLEWDAIFRGSIVGEMEFDSPVLKFTKDKVELSDLRKDSTEFRKLLKDFMPLKINRLEVRNGDLHYADNTTNPKVDVALKQLQLVALNLSNVTHDTVALPSTVTASATVYEGKLNFDMKLNALNEDPTFDLNCELENTNLVLLNDLLKAYGNFDVNKGTFGLYTEMAAKDGKFAGYVKPIIKNLDVVGPQDKHDSFFNKVYEQIVGAAGVILRNPKEKQVATKVNLEGDFENPEASTIDAVWEVLRNAFIQALIPSVDYEISLQSIDEADSKGKRNLLQRIFKSGKNKDEESTK